MRLDRRTFLKVSGAAAIAAGATACRRSSEPRASEEAGPADYTIRIAPGLVELAPDRIIATTLYNNQFPGPLIRLREGRPVTIDLYNDTDTPEQLHWHGQTVGVDVDGSAEEGTPFIAPHGHRRITFTPGPAGVRFYHTHAFAGPDLRAGQYGGQVGPLYIEPKDNPGAYDQEIFLLLKEFEPSFSRGGDMPMDFLSPTDRNKELESTGESAMRASLAKGLPHGFEVGYDAFSINGRMLGHGDPIRVKEGQRVLLHVINGSATEIRSLALPGHVFEVVALDGNPVPTRAKVPVLWIGTGERVSAVVTMTHPGIWVLGDVGEDRDHGMGIVVEYAGAKGKPQWTPPPPFKWDYARFGTTSGTPLAPEETIDVVFRKDNAAANGFNRWLINDVAFSMDKISPRFQIRRDKRYRLHMRNASDDIHPMHLHRHSFELTQIAGHHTSGVVKDVVMLGGYQEMDVEFTADAPGLSLFHCHMQLHMDYGFMALFDCQ
ncbi:MAG TPA: multicopper oxidase domain-containing protein [Vicinamibacterales bacterium]|nr:multicopper oxidase domain-containing protein [Vicinamibacterales bacterium]